ncbi:hypothetical protein CRUP_010434 [Coryphaenoides rupestris]|nr:hypothetical protein CRUP_010434 [Coryphaenoides rupestris]
MQETIPAVAVLILIFLILIFIIFLFFLLLLLIIIILILINLIFLIINFLIIIIVTICWGANGKYAQQLLTDLFANYTSALRPVEDTGTILNVTLQITLSQIIDMVPS